MIPCGQAGLQVTQDDLELSWATQAHASTSQIPGLQVLITIQDKISLHKFVICITEGVVYVCVCYLSSDYTIA